MQTRHYIIIAAAVVASFAGGFFLANSLNKSALDSLGPAPPERASDPPKTELAAEEIKSGLRRAEENQNDFSLQKNLGISLYRYAAATGDEELLNDVEKLLERAHKLNPDDYVVLVAYANLNLDIARAGKDKSKAKRSRELFLKALDKNPRDVRVLSDLALTYLEFKPPQPEAALKRLQEASKIDARDEEVLLNTVRAHLVAGSIEEAGLALAKLKEVNPRNPEIARFEGRIRMEGIR